jgi:hypothetical protein
MFGFYDRTANAVTEQQIHRIGKNSEAFTIGDAIAEASGFGIVSLNSSRLLGFSAETITMASNNQTVAQYRVAMIPALPGMEVECDFDAAVTQATAVGFYAVLTGTTGAQKLASASLSATVGQFRVTKLDPRGEGSETRVLATPVFTAFSHTTAS